MTVIPGFYTFLKGKPMKITRKNSLIIRSILLLTFITIIGCGMEEARSTWCNGEVVIDGIDSGAEWENARYYLSEQKVTIGLKNDDKYLYVRLSTSDHGRQRQILSSGGYLWCDGTGTSKKTFGIHFPIGSRGNMERQKPDGSGKNMEQRPMQGNDSGGMGGFDKDDLKESGEMLKKMLLQVNNEIEIIGPGKNSKTKMYINEAEKSGILARIDESKGSIVYELKIPFERNESQPYGIGSLKNNKVAIGLDLPAMSMMRQQGKDNSGRQGGRRGGGMDGGIGGSRGGGMGGMGGDMGGMGGMGESGGRGGGMQGSRPNSGMGTEAMELWLKTDLASKPMTK
jgi:hypothetical protein